MHLLCSIKKNRAKDPCPKERSVFIKTLLTWYSLAKTAEPPLRLCGGEMKVAERYVMLAVDITLTLVTCLD